jgi:hypothetical protein
VDAISPWAEIDPGAAVQAYAGAAFPQMWKQNIERV